MIGLILLGLALIYELYALVFKKQTISAFIWILLDNKWIRAAFFFTWVWLTVHFFWPGFFS